MRAGLTAGALTAIVAVLVSLPLHSPLDNVFNSATVAIATLVAGIAAGLLWGRPRGGLVLYAGALSAALVVTIAVMAVGSLWLDRLASFGIPLAVIAFVGAGALTPVAARLTPRPLGYLAGGNSGGGGIGSWHRPRRTGRRPQRQAHHPAALRGFGPLVAH